MSWIGVESADEDRPRDRGREARRDWMLRVRLDGRTVESRLLDLTEREAHGYARRLAADYTLRPLGSA